MTKLSLLTKRINEKITLGQSILGLIISGFATVLLLAMIAKYNYYALLVLILPIVVLWIYSTNIAIHKTADDMYIRMQNTTFQVIEKDLSSSFTRVKFVNESNSNIVKNIFSNLNVSFWAKLDENGTITLIAKDSGDTIIYEERTRNYIWFIKNFYIYKFFYR